MMLTNTMRNNLACTMVIISTATSFVNLKTVSSFQTTSSLISHPSSLAPLQTNTLTNPFHRSKHAHPQFHQQNRLSMVSYDDLMERLPSKSVIDAIESSPSTAVVASDIAAAAGVSLPQARKDLTTLASLSQGDIAVSKDGELIYSFPSNLNSVLSSNSQKFRLLRWFRKKVWPPLFYGIRVSFGVALLVSIFAIFSTIAVISSGSSSNDDRDRGDNRRGGGGMSFGFGGGFWGPSPFDFFYYRPYNYGYYGRQNRMKDPEEMGFLESIFSYIFGDGNPNEDMEEQQLQLVSDLIRENNGAVTAEQLAPFILSDDLPSPDSSVDDLNSVRYVDESYVLPIVTQLDGEPRVTEDGDIVYLFPEMQVSAQSDLERQLVRAGLPSDASSSMIKEALMSKGVRQGAFIRGMERRDVLALFQKNQFLFQDDFEAEDDQPFDLLQEREYKFSLASDTNKLLAGGLGALNLGGALYLAKLLSSVAAYGVRLPSYYGLVQSAFPLLLGYAILYNAIPIGRNLYISNKNKEINQRNSIRRKWRTQVLSSSAGRIARKLKEARKMGTKMKQLGGKTDIIFDTQQTSTDVSTTREKDAMKDFDKLLGEE